MDLALYASIALTSIIGRHEFDRSYQHLKKKLKTYKQLPVYSPVNLIQELRMENSIAKNYIKKQNGQSVYQGDIFLEGKIDSPLPIQSKLEQLKVLFSQFYTDNIYSNDKFRENYYFENFPFNLPDKIKTNKDSAPFYILKDADQQTKKNRININYNYKPDHNLQSNDQNNNISDPKLNNYSKNSFEIKIQKNLDAVFLGVINLISYKKHYSKYSLFQKIWVFLGMFLQILSAQSKLRFHIKGVKIGYKEIELGIMPGQYVTLLGKIIYNELTDQIQMKDLKYIVKDKSLVLEKLEQKLIQKNFLKHLLMLPMIISLFLLFKNTFIRVKKYVIKKQEQKMDKLRDFSKIFITDEMRCLICVDNVRNIILKPCKHMCLCNQCFQKLQKKECPICKTSISDKIEIFIS